MKNYSVILTGVSGEETTISTGTNKKTVLREAREYLRYADRDLGRTQISQLVSDGFVSETR